MANIQSINRLGYLRFDNQEVGNQCKATGHREYRYELKIHCGWGTRLNNVGFIIDHQHLDEAVQRVRLDSCEKMGASIISEVSRTLLSKGVPYTGINLRLQPVLNGEEMKAFFEISHTRRFSWLRLFLSNL